MLTCAECPEGTEVAPDQTQCGKFISIISVLNRGTIKVRYSKVFVSEDTFLAQCLQHITLWPLVS